MILFFPSEIPSALLHLEKNPMHRKKVGSLVVRASTLHTGDLGSIMFSCNSLDFGPFLFLLIYLVFALIFFLEWFCGLATWEIILIPSPKWPIILKNLAKIMSLHCLTKP